MTIVPFLVCAALLILYFVFRIVSACSANHLLAPKALDRNAILGAVRNVNLYEFERSLLWVLENPTVKRNRYFKARHSVETRFLRQCINDMLMNCCYVQQVGLTGNDKEFRACVKE